MSKASKIILLCEDKLQEVFIKRFLKRRWNINTERDVKTVAYPAAKGSAEQRSEENTSALQSRITI